jgi:hypothetical protein
MKGEGMGNDLGQASAMAMHQFGYAGTGANGMMMPQVGMSRPMGMGMGGFPQRMMQHPMMMGGAFEHHVMAQMMGGGFHPGFLPIGMPPQAMAHMMGGGGGMGVGGNYSNEDLSQQMLQQSGADNGGENKGSHDMLSSPTKEMRKKKLKMTPKADV